MDPDRNGDPRNRHSNYRDQQPLADLIGDVFDLEPTVREAAVQALGVLGTQARAAVGLLKERLDDPDEETDVRVGAALALGQIGGEEATAALLAALPPEQPVSGGVAASADWFIIDALGALRDPQLLPILLAALEAPDVDVQKAARAGLVHLGEPAVVPVIAVLLDRTKASVTRVFAADTLAWLGDARAIEPCKQVLADRSDGEYVRGQSALTLGRLGGPGVYDLLIVTLRDAGEPEFVRRDATKGLGVLGDRRAYDLLVQVLSDGSGPMRWDAAEALGNLGDSRAAAPLNQALRDRDVQVRRTAAQALGQVGDERTIPALEAAKRAENDSPLGGMVRRTIEETIARIRQRANE